MLAREHDPFEVHVHDPVPCLAGDRGRTCVTGTDADVVVKDVDAIQAAQGRSDQVGHRVLVGHLGLDREGIATGPPDGIRRLPSRVDAVVGADDPGALPAEADRSGASVPDGGAGGLPGAHDNGGLSFETTGHAESLPSCGPFGTRLLR